MAYPLLTWTDGERIEQEQIQQVVPQKEVTIQYANSISDMLYILENRLKEGGCACIITNTVKAAQDIYQECINKLQAEVILYHAQFIMPDRYKKEQELLKRMGKDSCDADRNRLILIGTQVLEQSLDYDADIMVTHLCPMDLLLQRIGRLHRHPRDGKEQNGSRPQGLQKPECIILRDGNEAYDSGSQAVYGDYLLMRTAKILKNTIKIPEDIPLLVQKVYYEEDSLGLYGEAYQTALNRHREMLKSKKQEAKGYLMKEPEKI